MYDTFEIARVLCTKINAWGYRNCARFLKGESDPEVTIIDLEIGGAPVGDVVRLVEGEKLEFPEGACVRLFRDGERLISVTPIKQAEAGKKYDTEKTRVELLPVESLEAVAQVMTHGAQKYGDDNWQGLERFEDRYYAAALRHLFAWRRGEPIDPESKFSHLAHAACNVLFLLWKERQEK